MTDFFRKSASSDGIATEVTSLRWLEDAVPDGGAAVVELVASGGTWLETRMLETSPPSRDDAREFGRRLAHTHAAGADWFGSAPPGLSVGQAVLAELPSPSLEEPRYAKWGSFFAELRLQPYLDMASEAGTLDRSESRRLSRFIDRVADGEFDAEQPQAVNALRAASPGDGPAVARIHGDLWSGNVVWASGHGGSIGTLIDPSAHGGHAETDLAELGVFGSPQLPYTIAGYQEVSPLANGWEQRVPVHQLHMLLVHVVLFGGGYVSQALGVADRFS